MEPLNSSSSNQGSTVYRHPRHHMHTHRVLWAGEDQQQQQQQVMLLLVARGTPQTMMTRLQGLGGPAKPQPCSSNSSSGVCRLPLAGPTCSSSSST